MDIFPSSPSSTSSSANLDHLSPRTPDSYFSSAPAVLSPDEFTFQIDVQLDEVAHRSSVTHPFPTTGPGDDVSKVQVLMRNAGRWGKMRDRLENSPPLRARIPSQDGASDDFSWEATHSPFVGSNQLPDPSRCSLLIHELSLLVGMTENGDYLFNDDGCPLPPDASKQARGILPLGLTPTKPLAARQHRNAGLPHCTNMNFPVHSSDISIAPCVNPHANDANPILYNPGYPPVGSRDPPTPIPRQKNADAPRPSLSPRRRQGQVFLEPSLSNPLHRNAVLLDELFSHPRQPPPKPTLNLPANRCSSLDRLEYSLLKLEAHAPSNHRKSRSEEQPSDYVAQRMVNRPPLPPSPRLKHHRSRREIMQSHPAHGYHLWDPPPPVPRPVPPRQYDVPQVCPAVPLDKDPFEEDPTPGSFMDMDIPATEGAQPKQCTSFRHVKGKEKVKSLVSAAKRMSRGVISWGKNLSGSTKPPLPVKEITTPQSVRV